MKKITILVLTLLLLFIAGCKGNENDFEDVENAGLLAQAIDNLQNAQSFEATSLMTMDISNMMSITYDLEIIGEAPDKAYVKLVMEFLGEQIIAEYMIDGDQFHFHMPMMEELNPEFGEEMTNIYGQLMTEDFGCSQPGIASMFIDGGQDQYDIIDNPDGLGAEYRTYLIQADRDKLLASMREGQQLEQNMFGDALTEEELAEFQGLVDTLYSEIDLALTTTAVIHVPSQQFHTLNLEMDYSIPMGDFYGELLDEDETGNEFFLPETLIYKIVMEIEYKSINKPVTFPPFD